MLLPPPKGSGFPQPKKFMKLFFDIETTGLDKTSDEILQLSIINENEDILFNDLFRPVRKKEWVDAQKVNGISSEMVKDKKSFNEVRSEIQNIFSKATELIAYNTSFDIGFLRKNGIVFPEVKITDPMLDFSNIYREWDESRNTYKWKNLAFVSDWFEYGDFNAHDSLEDIRATKYIYDIIEKNYKSNNLWQTVNECYDETGKPTCWSRRIDSSMYGRFLWITINEKGNYLVAYLNDKEFVVLKECKSLSSAKRWATQNIVPKLPNTSKK